MRASERARSTRRAAIAARASLRLRALLGCALVVVSTAAFADYKEDYADGLKAAGDGKWGEVQRRMTDALKEQPAPEVQMRLYGQRFEPYVPAFFLGIALAKQGDCEVALQYLKNPATQKVVNDSRSKRRLNPFMSTAQKSVSDCEAKLAGGSTAAPKPASPGTPATSGPATVASNTPPASTATPSAPPAAPAPKPGAPASKPVAANTPAPVPSRPPTPAAPASSTAPAALTTALDDYLRGRYQQVVAVDPNAITDRRARFHALLLRAAARYTLAQLQGGNVAQAAADVRAAKALDGAAPDAVLFSPRFRKFYSETR